MEMNERSLVEPDNLDDVLDYFEIPQVGSEDGIEVDAPQHEFIDGPLANQIVSNAREATKTYVLSWYRYVTEGRKADPLNVTIGDMLREGEFPLHYFQGYRDALYQEWTRRQSSGN